ncbi:MAG: hypothetical protein KC413_02480 [Anaerolineales bacterium]|nr:hypothetical protein [Anaerolineales bacterium]MCA9974580.1 hypothetical protein [Anaerolineales bacterium]MCB8967089.1 hypothetical protein [Ardenticatenaceae bacterium]MCB8992240.1 hypothetical protein [Ardenticatenaceae bacterium]
MELVQFLEAKRAEIVDDAHKSLERVQLQRYTDAGAEKRLSYLDQLYKLLVISIKERNLTKIVQYAEQIAEERFAANFSLLEVQTGFNVLEEAIWKSIVEEVPPADLAEAIGLVSTVHGAGKDALARRYVSLASKTKAPSLNLSALFKGSEGT